MNIYLHTIYIYSYIHINCTYDLPTNFSFFPLSRKSRIYFRPYRSVGRCRPKSWLFRHEFQPPYVKKQTRHRILHRIFQLISRSHGWLLFFMFFQSWCLVSYPKCHGVRPGHGELHSLLPSYPVRVHLAWPYRGLCGDLETGQVLMS